MALIEFRAWPKISRLNRDITVTEKIDGTNAAVGIAEGEFLANWETGSAIHPDGVVVNLTGDNPLVVYAQSRKALITPNRDNHGFARWVWDNAEALASVLGPGLHYGEWWGSGIQRGYGMKKGEKRFSLFNTKRWSNLSTTQDRLESGAPNELRAVPVLYEGPFDPHKDEWANTGALWGPPPWALALGWLRVYGSFASRGFMRPEGVVVYHHAADAMFKVTLENDEQPKSAAELNSLHSDPVRICQPWHRYLVEGAAA